MEYCRNYKTKKNDNGILMKQKIWEYRRMGKDILIIYYLSLKIEGT